MHGTDLNLFAGTVRGRVLELFVVRKGVGGIWRLLVPAGTAPIARFAPIAPSATAAGLCTSGVVDALAHRLRCRVRRKDRWYRLRCQRQLDRKIPAGCTDPWTGLAVFTPKIRRAQSTRSLIVIVKPTLLYIPIAHTYS